MVRIMICVQDSAFCEQSVKATVQTTARTTNSMKAFGKEPIGPTRTARTRPASSSSASGKRAQSAPHADERNEAHFHRDKEGGRHDKRRRAFLEVEVTQQPAQGGEVLRLPRGVSSRKEVEPTQAVLRLPENRDESKSKRMVLDELALEPDECSDADSGSESHGVDILRDDEDCANLQAAIAVLHRFARWHSRLAVRVQDLSALAERELDEGHATCYGEVVRCIDENKHYLAAKCVHMNKTDSSAETSRGNEGRRLMAQLMQDVGLDDA